MFKRVIIFSRNINIHSKESILSNITCNGYKSQYSIDKLYPNSDIDKVNGVLSKVKLKLKFV